MSKLKYGKATVSAVAALVGVAGISSLSPALADDVLGIQVSDLGTQRAKIEFEIQKQECDTLKNSQPQGYESCLQKAQSTRDNLLTQAQGSAPAGPGPQAFGSNQSQQQFSGQEKGTFDKMTSAVKETVAEVKEKLFGSSDQGREGPQGQSTGQQQGGGSQGPNPLQQGFDARHMQGQDFAPQNLGAGRGQGGQNFGQQGLTQGQQGQQEQFGQQGSFQGGQQPQGQSGQQGGTNQQFQGQQGQFGQQGSFQGGQQPQGQSGQQGTGGTNQQLQSGGTESLQGSTGGWAGEKQGAHMKRGEYYQALARVQYVTLKQECNTLKQDPNVYEQCQKHAESVRAKILAMAEEGDQRGG